MDSLNRGQAPFPSSIWKAIDEAASQAARDRLTGRRFLDLEGPFPLEQPVTLAQLRDHANAVRAVLDQLKAAHPGSLYFPFFFWGGSELRPMQPYLNKLPAELVAAFPQLATAVRREIPSPRATYMVCARLPKTTVFSPWMVRASTPVSKRKATSWHCGIDSGQLLIALPWLDKSNDAGGCCRRLNDGDAPN